MTKISDDKKIEKLFKILTLDSNTMITIMRNDNSYFTEPLEMNYLEDYYNYDIAAAIRDSQDGGHYTGGLFRPNSYYFVKTNQGPIFSMEQHSYDDYIREEFELFAPWHLEELMLLIEDNSSEISTDIYEIYEDWKKIYAPEDWD